MTEFIICAALKHVDTGKIYYGHRHSHCVQASNEELSWTMNRKEICSIKRIQGFVTNLNRFVTREQALIIAVESKQYLNKEGANRLYSEDLY